MTKTDQKRAGIARRAREAADNPAPFPPAPPQTTNLELEHYRGYLIRTNLLQGYIWIERDGQKIASCPTVQDARVQIDILTQGKS